MHISCPINIKITINNINERDLKLFDMAPKKKGKNELGKVIIV